MLVSQDEINQYIKIQNQVKVTFKMWTVTFENLEQASC